jgi:SAM-dependent methyltransferase
MRRSRPVRSEGWLAGVFHPFWGLPSGPIGWVGARSLPLAAGWLYGVAADHLYLGPEDELLDVGCGSGVLLADHARGVRFAAGIDASQIQVELARRRLSDRIAAGTAQIVLGDATALPWPDGRFSAVVSLNCLKFVPGPGPALREMHRVLRPGGRVLHVTDRPVQDPDSSGSVDAFGARRWSTETMRRLMEQAGFVEVSVAQLTSRQLGLMLVQGARPD